MYDIFYVTKSQTDYFLFLKKQFPTLKRVETFHEAQLKSLTEFFWVIWDDIIVNNIFNFDYVPDAWSNKYVHVFKNGDYYDGICLVPKNVIISKKEIEHRFFVNKKEIDIVASKPKPYDIVFISYQEPNADESYNELLKKYPTAKRIHGIKGIHQAHMAAANLCDTDMFWVVDGDAIIDDSFNFKYCIPYYDANGRETVYVWRSQNPINDLVYGYGGIKLFPRQLTIDMDTSKPDMTTSISSKFKAINQISNITGFNTDPFNTWKSAFRECVKLSSRAIDRQKDNETQQRLQTWCSVGIDQPYGKYALDGAKQGAWYGAKNKNNLEALKMINNFEWLREQFDARNI
jgi:hypothetical protein